MSAGSEVLEVRQVLSAATLSATLVNGLLTVSDTSLTPTNNTLTTTLVGTDLVITDAHEQFISAPEGGTLSNGGLTLTIPASLVTSGLTIDAGGGDDVVHFEAIDGAFSANLVVDGGSGNDTVDFQAGAVNVGVGSIDVAAEQIDILSAVTAGGAVQLTSTGDDTGISNFASITAGADSTFSADKMNLNSTISVGTHKLTLIPGAANGPGDAIDIGSTDSLAVDTLELSNAELNRITASQLVIGNVDSALITISAAIELTEDADVQVVSGYSLLFAAGSSWTTTNGDLSFSGGGTASGTGHLNGIELVNARISSGGTGAITLSGQGGNGADFNAGILARDGSIIESTGSGTITLTGVGGVGTAENRGLEIADATITSAVGDMQLWGQGGDGISSFGIWIRSGAIVDSTGTAKISIDGTAGDTYDANGVYLSGNGGATRVSTVDGELTIVGHGGDRLDSGANRGVLIADGSVVQSTGMAKITVNGTGGDSNDSSRGVEICDPGTKLTSVSGDITIIGHAGAGLYAFGIWFYGQAILESTGTAKITMDGTGGSSGGNNSGIFFAGYAPVGGTVRSVDGDINIIGRGGDVVASSYNPGVGIFAGTVIESTGMARITINGTAGAGVDAARGVEIGGAGTSITSERGDITITGQGAAGSSADRTFNIGVWIRDSAVVESTAIAGPAAKITINGTGGAGTGSDVGVWMTNFAQVSSTLGDISVTGTSNSQIGIFNRGVNLEAASIISQGIAKITVDGTAGGGAGNEIGVYLEDANSIIQSLDGDISVTGRGGASGGNNNVGVCVGHGVIESLGVASITVNGTGGASSDSNIGVWVRGANGAIRSNTGPISITGTGGQGTSYSNIGVVVNQGGVIESTGTATITIAGTGGTGVPTLDFPYGQYGVLVEHSNSAIRSKDGDIHITGIAGGDAGSTRNHGVMLDSGVVETTAGGIANISITGTAGPGSTSFGIQVQSDSGTVSINTSAGTGDILLISDSINIEFVTQPGLVSAGANTVAISPKTPGTAINLGSTDAAGTLGLTDPELDRITANSLIIGSSSSGTITISSDITRASATNMQLVSGSNVVISGGQLETHGGSLLLDAGAAPHVVNPLHAGVDVVASLATLDGGLSIAINGIQVDSGYTQFNVAGGVNLNGVNLQLSGGYIPQSNESFVIVNNDGDEPVTGAFNGLAEGTIFNFNGRSLQITYEGGDGNDVVLSTVNIAPEASGGTLTTAEDTPSSGVLMATDIDSPTLTFSIVSPPAHGTVIITNTATGAYTYTPDADYNGSDSFTFKANDGQVDSNVATISITIVAVNDAPQLNLNGGAVTFSAKAARRTGPPQIVPNMTVIDPDQPATSGLGGGTLTISIDASTKTTKKGVKLHDTIGGLSQAATLGMTTGALVSNGKLVLTIQLNAGTSTNDIQTFLRGITFATKGPGLKLTPRIFQAQITDAAGAASNLLQQTVNVTK